jgi:transcriptional regulator with XRE-family HTH domain
MKLTQPEIIQVLRKRSQMNQGEFGSQAFNTSYESGRTKVKNIELGKQKPSEEDIKKMARVLNVDLTTLLPETESEANTNGLRLSDITLALLPGLGDYLEMLDKAAQIGDEELINYICQRLSEMLSQKTSQKAMNQ